MSEQPETPATAGADEPAAPMVAPIPAVKPPVWTPPAPPQDSSGASGAGVATDRPEVAVGAAFAGGLVLALILKRLAR